MYLLLCSSPVTGRGLRCAALHPLHHCMQISIPVSKCQPLTIPMNTKIFSLKWGTFNTAVLPWQDKGSDHRCLWATVEKPVATSFTGLILKGGGCTCNMPGSSSIRCVTRALTGPERGGELPSLGLCRARVCRDTLMQCRVPALQADMSRAWTSWSGIF